jgi:hypothetical protein
MSADLVLRLASQVGVAARLLRLRYVNTTATPIVSATWLDSGCAIADVYTLTVLSKVGTAAVIKVECNVKNPYQNLTGVSCVADGTTVNKTIVPGVGIVLSGTCDVGHVAKMSVGADMDLAGVVTDVLDFGVVQAGVSTTGVRIACENIGDAAAQQTMMYSLPGLYFFGTAFDTLIASIKPHTDTARHKLASAGTLAITFANWTTDGVTGKKKADVLVGGATAIVGALFDGTSVYQYGSGNGYVDAADLLAGLSLVLANTTVDPSTTTITLKVADGWNWVQFASDTSGSPGVYSNQDLNLTESGQATGTITPGHAGFFWVRWSPPSAALAGDMRKAVQRARGLTT